MTRLNLVLLVSLGLTFGCFKGNQASNDPGAGEYDGYYGEGGQSTPGGGVSGGEPPRSRDVLGTRGAPDRKGKKLVAKKPPKDPKYVPPARAATKKIGVTDFSPTFGGPGTLVTIHGGGFNKNSKVKVGGKDWEVVERSDSALVARVPEGAKSGVIEVKIGKLSRKSEANFGALVADGTFGRPSTRATRGLLGDLYLMEGEVSELPGFDSLGQPIGTVAVDTLEASGDFSGFPTGGSARKDWFALHFKGSVNVTEAGEYDLCLSSDDGAQLYLEQSVIVDNDGVHEAKEVCELVYMDPGEYGVDLLYFQGTGPVALSWTWAKDGGGKVPVPVEALFPPE